jgi:hypothetical protein
MPNAPFEGSPAGTKVPPTKQRYSDLIKVHYGFLVEWQFLKNSVFAEIKRLRSEGINYDILRTPF